MINAYSCCLRHLSSALGLALVLSHAAAHAQLRVEVTGVGSNQLPIAVINFQKDGTPAAQSIDDIVRADLQRSGLFRLVDAGTTPLPVNAQVNLPDWKARGADAGVIGSVASMADGRYDIS